MGAVTLAFTVKDAAGTILVGTPVTFTADSTNVSWKSSSTDTANRQLVYTDSLGVATTYIAGWVAPSTVTVTATAGTATVTTTVNLVTVAADARTIALSTSGGIVKATVKDRFGNPTKGEQLTGHALEPATSVAEFQQQLEQLMSMVKQKFSSSVMELSRLNSQ